MSTKIKFPYQYKTIDFGQIPDPYVELAIKTPQGWQSVNFLVDSGADATSLPDFLADIWEIKLDRRKRTTMGGVEGKGVKAYPSEIEIKLGEEELTVRCYFIESETVPLLGRVDIWDHFNLFFDNQKKEIVFESLKKDSIWIRFLNWIGFYSLFC